MSLVFQENYADVRVAYSNATMFYDFGMPPKAPTEETVSATRFYGNSFFNKWTHKKKYMVCDQIFNKF